MEESTVVILSSVLGTLGFVGAVWLIYTYVPWCQRLYQHRYTKAPTQQTQQQRV